MSRRARHGLFLVAAAGLAALFLWGLSGLPDFGRARSPYGVVLNRTAVGERHVTNVVAAVVFDYRGVDTLGEEFILFAAVMGVALLLREAREEGTERSEDAARGDALRAVGLGLIAPTVVLGLYLVAHGYLTPGGGFQGGVAAAAGLVLLYLAGGYGAFRRASPLPLVDLAEGAGAGGYAAVGVAGLIAGVAFLDNALPYGSVMTLASGGTIPVLNAAAGLAVTAAFVLLFREFLEEVR